MQIDTVENCPVFAQSLNLATGPGRLVFFRSDYDVDVDGSPRAYGPGNMGEDYTANAGRPGNWWGIVTGHNGAPIIQGATDPAPGFYISTTSLQDHSFPAASPDRYVDSDTVPFIVLPVHRFAEWGIKLGDFAWVQRLHEGFPVAAASAIFADACPRAKLGEGSWDLARVLGINPDPRRGGEDGRVVQYYVFAGSGDGKPHDADEIDRRVRTDFLPALRKLGGLATPILD